MIQDLTSIDYKSSLDLLQTQKAIKFIKDTFESLLAESLGLTRVSAPLFVLSSSGLNDGLSGKEKAISFLSKEIEGDIEIVHSLAKWKRYALHRYNISVHEGIYTDMNAIRKDERLDPLHSIYVDQWDYELCIEEKDRNLEYLKETVRKIYIVLLEVSDLVSERYGISHDLPKDIFFITSEELLSLYPTLSPKEREEAICKDKGAVFLIGIGHKLSNGLPHDSRAPDYDDWNLNGDILLYYPLLDTSFEISSMGIRVSPSSLKEQLSLSGRSKELDNPYCKAIIDGRLPYSLGGGIGQSRLCMYFLNKAHIGEVQASLWNEEEEKRLSEFGISLL